MSKVVRNTVFTLVILALTAFGLGWNKQKLQKTDPVRISQNVLSSVESDDEQPFKLELKFDRSHVKLGQYQEMSIQTEPFAELEIVTVYPNGSINNPQTLRATASETGQYANKFKLTDFAHLGVFETVVRATLGDKSAKTTGRFALQTWIQADKALGNDEYIYPILP